jgi:hypothetical protein
MKKRTNTRPRSRSQVTLTYLKPLSALSREEAHTWIQGMRERLTSKMQRERAYLDRRAARGAHTPTDEAYEADQLLETELLTLLDDILQGLSQEA